jgi:hypothetical protein
MSIYPVLDELNSDKHTLLDFLEFKEAYCRAAEVLSFIPYGENNFELWNDVRRVEQPLIMKIRNLISYMTYYERDLTLRE